MNPFNLDDEDAYQRWREQKLKDYPQTVAAVMVEIQDPRRLSTAEKQKIDDLIAKTNFALYASSVGDEEDKNLVHELGHQFGLHRLDHNLNADEDAVTSLTPADGPPKQGYIPYTHRPIAWHTDGYYNDLDRQIYGLILHCVRPAVEGGVNELLDHEIIYIQLRDQDPDYIRVLQQPEVMSIPPNVVAGQEIRGLATGPVFMHHQNGSLHMRYTHRKRNIIWSADAQAALQALHDLLQPSNPYYFQAKLQSGQGLICNNILHTRSGFEKNSQRLLYRGRYYDRIGE